MSRLALTVGTVDLETGTLHAPDGEVRLTDKERALLAYLAARSGETVSREELLTEVWSYHPRSRTRAVDFTVRRLRAKVEQDPRCPEHILNEYGKGYRFVALQPTAAGRPGPAGPSGAPSSGASGFFGRQDVLATAGGWLSRGQRLVSLIGPPGIGKTRIALELARSWDDKARFVDLTEVRNEAGVLHAVAQALDRALAPDASRAVERVARMVAAHGPVLLILDNVEQVVDAGARLVAQCLLIAPEARWLITSRTRLRLPEERCLQLLPLDRDAAVELFVDRARAVRPTFSPDGHTVGAIVDRLGRIPLALELAAARVGVMDSRRLLERLQHSLEALASSRRSARQATLRGAIQWSWDLLEAAEREAFAQLSVFVGGFDLEAAEAVLDLGADAPDALDVVASLCDQSLLWSQEAADGGMRLGMYGVVREYAAEQLTTARPRVEARHRDWFVARGEALLSRLDAPDAAQALDGLALDLENLTAAYRRSVDTHPDPAVRILLALEALLTSRGPHDLLQELALGEASEDPRLEAHRLRIRAVRIAEGGAIYDAAPLLERAREIFASIGDRDGEVRALGLLSRVAAVDGRRDEARPMAEEALAWYRENGPRRRVAGVLRHLADLSPDFAEAERYLQESQAVARQIGDRRGEAFGHYYLGRALMRVNRVPEAEAEMARALELFRGAGDRNQEGYMLVELGSCAEEQHRFGDAVAHYRAARTCFASVGHAPLEGVALGSMGVSLYLDGQLGEAAVRFDEAVKLLSGVVYRRFEGYITALYGAVQADRGARDAAEGLLDGAAPLIAEAEDGTAYMRLCRAHLDLDTVPPGDPGAEATSWLRLARLALERARARNAGA